MKEHVKITLGILIAIFFLVGKIVVQDKLVKNGVDAFSLKPLQAGYHGQSLKKYSFGFDNLIADLIWVQLLQVASHEKLTEGKVSWEYAQLEAITALDPHFEHAYAFGSAFLSVFRDDKLGAKLLLEKWTKFRPNYWRAHYLLGYHLYYNMDDFGGASKEMLIAASLDKAPVWLSSLGIRLLNETGARTQALSQSIDLFSEVDDPIAKFRLKHQVRALHFALEKGAWVDALKRFEESKKNSPSDLEALRPYRTDQSRMLASQIRWDDIPEELQTVLNEKFVFQYDPKKKTIISKSDTQELEQTGIFRNNH